MHKQADGETTARRLWLRRAVIALGLASLLGLPAWADSAHRSAVPAAATAARQSIRSVPLPQRAAWMALALGRPKRLLIGLGTTEAGTILAQDISPDLYDQYLNGVGADSWINWNHPSGAYVEKVIQDAEMLGATPMFTLYQMAARGDGDISGIQDPAFMAEYWRNVRLLFQKLGAYGRPALVNFEPDFWGYAQRAQRDPTQHPAQVRIDSDCTELPDTVAGLAACLVQTARRYAPKAYVGFPPSLFVDLLGSEPAYMQRLGAGEADFVVMQTLDRDAGCMEAQYREATCMRKGKGWYWDESNASSPNFHEHFALARRYAQALQLPLLWWQTPLGVPAAQPSSGPPWRDNRVRYFLTHADELVAAGGFGVVFSPGERSQTTLRSDKGQFKTLSKAYLAHPAALP